MTFLLQTSASPTESSPHLLISLFHLPCKDTILKHWIWVIFSLHVESLAHKHSYQIFLGPCMVQCCSTSSCYMSILGRYPSLSVLKLDILLQIEVLYVVINSMFILYIVVLHLLLDLIMKLLHFCTEFFYSNTFEFTMLHVPQLWNPCWNHPIYYLEWDLSCTSIWWIIICKLCFWQNLIPLTMMFSDQTSHKISYTLIYHLSLSIYLRVICWTKRHFCPQFLP